eukprot:scaffold75874_cov34-Tisochrysis_lutea.AAC.1
MGTALARPAGGTDHTRSQHRTGRTWVDRRAVTPCPRFGPLPTREERGRAAARASSWWGWIGPMTAPDLLSVEGLLLSPAASILRVAACL